MEKMSVLYSYKSALYTVALDKEPEDLVHHCINCATLSKLQSLLDLCTLQIVGNASLMASAMTTVPTELHNSLLKAAVLLRNRSAVMQLMSTWPWTVLSLRNFAQPILTSLVPLFCENSLHEQMRRGVENTTCLANIFVECLKRRDSTKLRCLDLTGYPCDEKTVNYIASHVLLVFNEARQRQTIETSDSLTQELPLEEKQQSSLEYVFPDYSDEKFVVSIDAVLHAEGDYLKLYQALNASMFPKSWLKLRIRKLDMSSLGVDRIFGVLRLLDPEFLTGISVQNNDITNEVLSKIAPELKKFTHLSGLDLSTNSIDARSEEAAVILSDIVANLPSLQRLNLSGNRIEGSLSKILSNAAQPLTHLRMSGCGLTEPDFDYLLHSEHRLEELDIGKNLLLSGCFSRVLSLIPMLSPSLVILEMEDVGLRSDEFLLVFKACLQLQKLRLLNVERNGQLLRAVVFDSIKIFVAAPQLQSVVLSYPTDIEFDGDMDGQQVARRKEEYSCSINRFVELFCVQRKRCALQLTFRL